MSMRHLLELWIKRSLSDLALAVHAVFPCRAFGFSFMGFASGQNLKMQEINI